MAIKLEIASIDGVEDNEYPVFRVEACDEYLAEVTLRTNGFTVETWKEIADAILKAIEMLELKR